MMAVSVGRSFWSGSTSGRNCELMSNALASEFEITYAISSDLSKELIGPASAPSCQHAKYAMTYSTLFGNKRLTTSPFRTPCVASRLAVRITAAANSLYVRSDERRVGKEC